ncbi:MAG: TIGR03087 family PEP-CTERM/XrtA system glycosyltransferase [Neomegalonema sp.]|nr:TIGR03087 family PEP-CTERM/XrtA system glycosyltransferase [Neomegalonema sp.]
MTRTCLFIAHRIPYPADKGDKLRALAWLRHLAKTYRVTLVAGVDDRADWAHGPALAEIVDKVLLAPAGGLKGKIRGGMRLMSGKDLSRGYFRDPALAGKLADLPRFDLAFVYSSGAAGYLDDLAHPPSRLMIDFVDVDSAKWEQMAEEGRGIGAMLKGFEARALAEVETELAQRADASLLATEPEAQLFRQRTGLYSGIHALENGVDTAYWAAGRALPSPYGTKQGPVMILTGAMDYAPNVEGAQWFAEEILPRIQASHPGAHFVIAGARPAASLLKLGQRSDITVTGRVEDMRPWLAHADIAVAPLRLARGVQNKVLEAMAAQVPVVATRAALEGIDAKADEQALSAETPESFAAQICLLLSEPETAARLTQAANQLMLERYDWSAKTARLDALIAAMDDPAAHPAPLAAQ